jgi:hypothetical protein
MRICPLAAVPLLAILLTACGPAPSPMPPAIPAESNPPPNGKSNVLPTETLTLEPTPTPMLTRDPEMMALLDPKPTENGISFLPTQTPSTYPFGNPAGCPLVAPTSVSAMLASVDGQMGKKFDLMSRQSFYVWNGFKGSYINTTNDQFAYEFLIDFASPPLTWMADKVVTVFQTSGFVVYVRHYDNHFKLLAIPMVEGVLESIWGEYVTSYWKGKDTQPTDQFVSPVRKKLPCHWVVDAGYVTNDVLAAIFDFNWQMPDYMGQSHKYLADTCEQAYAKALTITSFGKSVIGDASRMCGTLAWAITNDANSFPYRIGNWYQTPQTFISTNPRSYGTPWSYFPQDTFDLWQESGRMNACNFEKYGDLYIGDILYSYGGGTEQSFDHIFMVTGIREDDTRISVSNLVRNYPYKDCSISEIALYKPGDLEKGFINYEWSGNGFGITGKAGFEVLRWKWISYHNFGVELAYVIRDGDTLETIAFDWKVDPSKIAQENGIEMNYQLFPGQSIILPTPK